MQAADKIYHGNVVICKENISLKPCSLMIIALIVINVLFSFAAFSNKEVMGRAIFNPYVIHENREWWRFVTSGFIHADFLHLFINMFVLYSFGDITLMLYEETFGELAIYYFLVMYFGG